MVYKSVRWHRTATDEDDSIETACDCKKKAESVALQSSLTYSTSKHRAASPLGSAAKREKYDVTKSGSLDSSPRYTGQYLSPASMANSSSETFSDQSWPYDLKGYDLNQVLSPQEMWQCLSLGYPYNGNLDSNSIYDERFPSYRDPMSVTSGNSSHCPMSNTTQYCMQPSPYARVDMNSEAANVIDPRNSQGM